MEIHTIKKDVKVVCIPAKTFPDGILAAHQKLHSIIPYTDDRSYYGVSWGDGNGGIIYKAASTILDDSEMEHDDLESFTIKKGQYLYEILKDYRNNIPGIKTTFAKLLTDPRIAEDGFCLEAYMTEKDLWCMVKLKE